MSDGFEQALIIHGNYYRFKAGEHLHRQLVHSRMQLWCHAGRGQVTVNGKTHEMTAGSLLVFPWRHEITYKADRRDPFFVSGMHLIPYCAYPDSPPWFQVPNHEEHPLADVKWMGNRPLDGFDETVSVELYTDHPLIRISSYICDLFYKNPIPEKNIRYATQIVLAEWKALIQENDAAILPHQLQRVCSYIKNHLDESLSLDDYARIAQCSSATLHRLSTQHFGCTLLKWQRQQQLQEACQLLRSTTQRIGRISKQCGFDDQLYFSRIFKQQFQMNPRAYRQRYGLM